MLPASEVLALNMAAMNAVIVVPMFAPMIKGTACFKVLIFLATIGTTTEVVMVLERIAAVVIKPQKNDFSSLVKKNRLKASGDPAFSKSDRSLRNTRMDATRTENEKKIST